MSVKQGYCVEIESLRGIAAIIVVLGHFYLLTELPQIVYTQIHCLNVFISAFFNPQPAVLLFFTISGFALGKQLIKEPVTNSFTYLTYIYRRGFRLIPLMWASILFAFLLNYFKVHEFHLRSMIEHLFLKDITLNMPLWSLQVELLCSLIFPVLFLAFVAGGRIYNSLLFVLLSIISVYWKEPIFIQYLVFFHAGLLVGSVTSKKISAFANTYLFVLFVLVFMLAPEFSLGARDWTYGHWQSWVLPEIIACPYILFYVLQKNSSYTNRFLRLKAARYLGKISFSIYLIHYPLLLLMLSLVQLKGLIPLLAFALLYMMLTLLISMLSYYFIELPSNQLGKLVVNQLSMKRKNNVAVSSEQ